MNKCFKNENEIKVLKALYELHEESIVKDFKVSLIGNEEYHALNYLVNHERWTENKYNGIDGIDILLDICEYCDKMGYILYHHKYDVSKLSKLEFMLYDNYRIAYEHSIIIDRLDKNEITANRHHILINASFKSYILNAIEELNIDINAAYGTMDMSEDSYMRMIEDREILKDILNKLDIQY